MESLFAVFMSVVVLVPTLIIAALITLAAVRGFRNKYVPSSSLVLESFSIKSDASGEPAVHITGRHKGIVFWILTNLGMQSRFQMTVTEKEWTLREGSLAGMKVVCVPLKRIRATICGYQRSLLAFFLAVVFALDAAWTLLGIFPILFRASHVDTEAGWEVAATQLAIALFSVFFSLVACGIAGFVYHLSKRVAFGVDAGHVYGIVFKRSFIGNTVIDLDAAEQATALLNRFVAAAVYDIPLAQLPPPSVQNQPTPGPGTLRGWMIAAMYVGLVVLAAVLNWYGKGVTLQISTAPTGTSVFLDNTFVGATSKETPLFLLPHTTREKHTLQFQCVGYEPLTQVVYVGGLESTQDVTVKLALPHYTVDVVTTPGNAHVAFDGIDSGVTNDRGFLAIPSIDRGEHELSISHDGFRTKTFRISINGRTSISNIVLVNEAEATRQEAEARQREIASHLERGRLLYRQGQYQGALDECDSVLKLDPSNAAALALKKQVEQTRKILGQ
jgi:hypothetical protein